MERGSKLYGNPGTPYWFLIDDGEPYEEKLI